MKARSARVTNQHGGTIAVDSEVSEFNEFVVTVPCRMVVNEGRPHVP
jgi:signal transduction histidine kinase